MLHLSGWYCFTLNFCVVSWTWTFAKELGSSLLESESHNSSDTPGLVLPCLNLVPTKSHMIWSLYMAAYINKSSIISAEIRRIMPKTATKRVQKSEHNWFTIGLSFRQIERTIKLILRLVSKTFSRLLNSLIVKRSLYSVFCGKGFRLQLRFHE